MASTGVACNRNVSFSFRQHSVVKNPMTSPTTLPIRLRPIQRGNLFSTPSVHSSCAPSKSEASHHLKEEYLRKSRLYDVELDVRDYEIDHLGVVNNAIYINYCQHGIEKLFEMIDINVYKVARKRDAFALSELSLKFLAPLRGGDKFLVRVGISDVTPAHIFFKVFIFKIPNQEPILEAKATFVSLNSDYRVTRLSEDMRSKLNGFFTTG